MLTGQTQYTNGDGQEDHEEHDHYDRRPVWPAHTTRWGRGGGLASLFLPPVPVPDDSRITSRRLTEDEGMCRGGRTWWPNTQDGQSIMRDGNNEQTGYWRTVFFFFVFCCNVIKSKSWNGMKRVWYKKKKKRLLIKKINIIDLEQYY